MPDPAVALRARARRFENRRSPTATRYSAEFRTEAVEHARLRIAAGVAVARVARELGLRAKTLTLWLRRQPRPRLRAVRVARESGPDAATLIVASETRPVVVTPGGLRIEGLDLDGVARLVRSLA